MMTIPFHPSSQMRLDREHLRATTLTTLTSACLSKPAGCFFSRLFCLFLQQKPSIGQYAIGHRIKRGKQCLALTTSFVFDCVCPWLVLNILSVYIWLLGALPPPASLAPDFWLLSVSAWCFYLSIWILICLVCSSLHRYRVRKTLGRQALPSLLFFIFSFIAILEQRRPRL